MSWDGAGSLPIALSSLIGRQAELDTLATLIPRARLLTIVGTGDPNGIMPFVKCAISGASERNAVAARSCIQPMRIGNR